MKIEEIKFELYEKHTKFEKKFPHGFDKSADLLSNFKTMRKIFFKLCVLFKVQNLSHQTPSKKPLFHCEPFVIYILQHWYQIQQGPLFFNLLLFLAFVVNSHDFFLMTATNILAKVVYLT